MTTGQEKVSGKSFNLGTENFPSRKITSKCDTVGHTYMDLYPLVPHRYPKKKTDEFNAAHFSTRNERTSTGKKSFDFNQNLQRFNYAEELIQHQIVQILEQSFEYSV